VDESALLEALVESPRRLPTDVHAEEPTAVAGLVSQPNVIATSHIGAFTQESVRSSGHDPVET